MQRAGGEIVRHSDKLLRHFLTAVTNHSIGLVIQDTDLFHRTEAAVTTGVMLAPWLTNHLVFSHDDDDDTRDAISPSLSLSLQ